MSKSKQSTYIGQYQKEHYDTVVFRLPKGGKAAIKARAAANGESLKSYIVRLLIADGLNLDDAAE